jgi:hypothetical protein
VEKELRNWVRVLMASRQRVGSIDHLWGSLVLADAPSKERQTCYT